MPESPDAPRDALPIEPLLPRLCAALEQHRAAVLVAAPGAGKTTRVPLALLDAAWRRGRIIVAEPRRLAARAAAARMAALLGEPVGQRVGYQVRFERAMSAATRIEVVTEGILVRRLQDDPALEGVDLVVFDEFHERHLSTDLAFALCRDAVRGLRPDLRLLVMSATLQGERVSQALEGAPLIESAGRQHPVTVHYLDREPSGPRPPQVVATVLRALAAHSGDVLVFLPGTGEIRAVEGALRERLADAEGIAVHPLYGDLPWARQQAVLAPGPAGGRRVILATPVAESSLTVPGVRVVVDSGWQRSPRFDARSGLGRLVEVRISRASADQRAGRAGREGPGVCYRLWSEARHHSLPEHPSPEIASADLAPLAFELAQWGVRDPLALEWLDPPPRGAFAQGRELLQTLGLLDDAGALTSSGRAAACLPAHPRLAAMLAQAAQRGLGPLACDVAALLEERDPLREEEDDLVARVDHLARARQRRGGGALSGVLRVAQAYRRALRLPADASADSRATGAVLALAYPDRIARQRAEGSEAYLMSGGRGARLKRSSRWTGQLWLVAPVVDAGSGEGLVHLAAPVDEEWLRETLADRVQVIDSVAWHARDEAVVAQREWRLGACVLERRPLSEPDPEQARAALLDGLRGLGIEALPWNEAARQWQARVLSLREWLPDERWPDVSDGALMADLEDWLAPYLQGVTRRAHLARLDLLSLLSARLDWTGQRRLDEGAPTHLRVPSGQRRRLVYQPDAASPALAVKLQEMFGLAKTPAVAWGQMPVTLHLLSPAGRPIQVTRDLAGFWERTYAEVRKELKGRYPKHPWPEDPWQAPPTARTRHVR
ncbi:ATP-dependent helicase HrpB [Ectothiorhodospiraceae bacterium 2226]|nr:ATP-dependent helicase HrpB [Ectothiorhodospiraceae bacterium 2226]